MIRSTGSPRLRCYWTADGATNSIHRWRRNRCPVASNSDGPMQVSNSKPAIIETDREHVEPGETNDLMGQRVLMRSGRTSTLIHVNADLLGLSYVTNDRQAADVVLRSAEHWRSYGTCASDAPSFHALAGLGARLLVSAGGTAVALLPLVRQFRSFLWREPGPFGATRADRNPSHVPHDPLLNAHVLKGCDGRCLHGFVPLINLCCL